MKKIIAVVAGVVLALGLTASSAQANKGWDRQGPKPEKPTVYAGTFNWGCGHSQVNVWAYQPDGAPDTKRGTVYRVKKFNPYNGRHILVTKGRIKSNDEDVVRARFRHSGRYIQVWTHGELVHQHKAGLSRKFC